MYITLCIARENIEIILGFLNKEPYMLKKVMLFQLSWVLKVFNLNIKLFGWLAICILIFIYV